MAIAFDAVSTGMDAADPTSLTWAHTCSGSSRILIVETSVESDTGGHTAQTVSSITYAGVNLTYVRSDYITDNGTEIWYLINPATGANNIVVTMTAVVDGLFGAGLSFTGVDQLNPIDNNAGTTTTGLSISQDITTNSADAMIVNIMQHYNSAAVLTPDGNQTQRFNTPTTGDNNQAGGTRLVTSATTYTTSWTTDISDGMTLSIVSLKAFIPGTITGLSSVTGQAIIVDSNTNTGEKTSVSSITQSHTTGTITNGAIFVRTATRGGSDASIAISSITYNGVALTSKQTNHYHDVDAGQLTTEIWALVNPASGAHDVVVTYGGAVNFAVAQITTFSGVNQTNPTEATGGGSAVGKASPISNSVTTITGESYLIDAVYSKTGAAITKGASQTLDAQVATNSGGDQTGFSTRGPIATPASTSMSWTYATADDYAQSIVAIKGLGPITMVI